MNLRNILLSILLIIGQRAFSQTFPYAEKWKEVEKQEIIGLLKSSRLLIDSIYAHAKQDGLPQQRIRALLYQAKIQMATEDKTQQEKALYERFLAEIEEAASPEKQILQSLLAGFVHEYYESNRYRISERTTTDSLSASAADPDFLTWDEASFQRVIGQLYASSMEETAMLQKEPVDRWEFLLDTAREYRELKPTLYDLLSHRAIDYYSAGNAQPRADSLLRELAAFHAKDPAKNAYLYNRLRQADASQNQGSLKERMAVLKKLAGEFPQAWYTAEILLRMANTYQQLSAAEPKEAYQQKKIYDDSVLAICSLAKETYPATAASQQLQETKDGILAPAITLQAETFQLPSKAIPVYLSHKNTRQIYVKVLKIRRTARGYQSQDFNSGRRITGQRGLDSLLEKYPPVQSYTIPLKSFDDYEEHRTVAAFQALEPGEYVLLVSNDGQWKADSSVVCYQEVKVSTRAIVNREKELLVTDRDLGKPLANLPVSVYQPSDDGKDLVFAEQVTTGADGQARLTEKTKISKQGSQRFVYQIPGEDVFFESQQYFPLRQNREAEAVATNVQFFTDRAIYRPGQTLYFKGIIYEEKSGQRRVLAGEKSTVELYDPSDDAIATLELTSNAYGSVSGQFIIPFGKATGEYYLEEESADGRKTFRVEEYKRPTFEVRMDTVKGSYKIGEVVTARGTAQSYSGAVLSEAKVSYRVRRNTLYPYRPWSGYDRYPAGDTKEIISGDTLTNEQGNFAIPFTAKPAEEKQAGEFRFYTYEVSVTVTDLNGETHEGNQRIAVGDKSVLLSLDLASPLNLLTLDSIPIQTNNLNGQPVPAVGNVRLYKLQGPDRVLRDMSLEEADYSLYDSLDFIRKFPHLPYGKEQDKNSWKKGKTVLDVPFRSNGRYQLPLSGARTWQEGAYLLEAYVVDGTDTLRASRLLQLYRPDAKIPADHEFLKVTAGKAIYEAGEQATIRFSSAVPDATVFVEVESNAKLVRRERIRLSNAVKTYTFPVEAGSADIVYVHYYMARYNAVDEGTLAVPVQQPASDLQITTRTFRDKLQPGQDETWELHIGGANKDQVMAEVVAGMYDRSLDAFASNDLRFPEMTRDTYSRMEGWNTSVSYETGYGSPLIYWPRIYTDGSYVLEDLNDFGFSFTNGTWKQRAYLARTLRQKNDQIFGSGEALYDELKDPTLREEVAQLSSRALTGAVSGVWVRGNSSIAASQQPLYIVDGIPLEGDIGFLQPDDILTIEVPKEINMVAIYGARAANGVVIITTRKGAEAALQQIKARTDLKETAFFFPDLQTDSAGNVRIRFTAPESLTQWKLMALAHTKRLETGYLELNARTSKDLMVVPNVPRFLREGDELELSAKIANLSGEALNGAVKLMLFDAFSMQPVDSSYALTESTRAFSTAKGGNTNVTWHLKVPAGQQTVVYRVVATAGKFSDGEENALPILPNEMLLTETLPLYAKEGQSKQFTLQALADAPANARHVGLTLEMTSNPLWYAIQALPYLQEYPYECSEQLFSRLYSTLVSKQLMDGSPKIKAIFDEWARKDGLQSRLETNPELKNILLEETPWVREAEDEGTRMKRLALLFDINNLRQQWQQTYQKLASRQLASGGFPWFEGGNASFTITAQIVAGFGQLEKMHARVADLGDSADVSLVQKAIRYLDKEVVEQYQDKAGKIRPGYGFVQYLYARSYFSKTSPLPEAVRKLADAFLKEPVSKKLNDDLQEKALLSLIYLRYGRPEKANSLLASLTDHAVDDDEKGMYWKTNTSGWDWWQSPVETQAALIEAFNEAGKHVNEVEQMKLWLIKNKQSTHWPSTKATTAAIYVLLSAGKDWLASEGGLEVRVGGTPVDLSGNTVASGYVKELWQPAAIQPSMAKVDIRKTSPGPVWGALYWQHFQKLNVIKSAATGVQLEKSLYLKKNSDKGPVLNPVSPATPIRVGDLITVRLVIRADRDLEFIHLKDMRASGFEPVNVLSSYKWQDGLGYYESTRDAATNFFIDRMPKGTYVFEYDVRANNAGAFSNGISSIQSMYAPEMSAHSEGIEVKIAGQE